MDAVVSLLTVLRAAKCMPVAIDGAASQECFSWMRWDGTACNVTCQRGYRMRNFHPTMTCDKGTWRNRIVCDGESPRT